MPGEAGTRPAREVRPGFVLPETELRWRFSRSSGPGGQGVNTTDSRAEVRFDVARSTAVPEPLRERALARLAGRLVDGELIVTSSEQRSQLRNREAALDRLVALLHDATAPPARRRRPTKPSRGAVERRLTTKRHRSQTKRTRRPGSADTDG
ncbi:alternative ribosome rescue aminoacyl-tRNA hydrolase ArfB [Pseudofrankia asymbiotica]|uniref:Aminoacyl-tRNA hydrolase n=1 Tax=Pseudofrankia asymbiotica TaxID=1834516 RepID=A0A1V2IKV7_9ACTN|nr:alternative ribosome rescue aminoacyl-tRNA hydrolase ArfB [Pseudofrankia asymbiotica]ONH33619.1 aminoacyl-tRNA hydrolase [Pseudofrankia asymbiotica]